MAISLEKKQELVQVTLEKRNVPAGIKLQVKTCMDISGSMRGLFSNGTVQETYDRLLPVAMRFDDNQSIESYAFGSGAARLSDVTPADFGRYVQDKFLREADRSGYLWSGTQYSRALALIAKDQGGGGFFSKKPAPTYLLFVTDGRTAGDECQSEEHLVELGKRNTYVQLIGLGRRDDFDFLERMADRYDHVGFVTFPDLTYVTDEQLYDQLLSDELAAWIRSR